jgi:hypothetical protein
MASWSRIPIAALSQAGPGRSDSVHNFRIPLTRNRRFAILFECRASARAKCQPPRASAELSISSAEGQSQRANSNSAHEHSFGMPNAMQGKATGAPFGVPHSFVQRAGAVKTLLSRRQILLGESDASPGATWRL